MKNNKSVYRILDEHIKNAKPDTKTMKLMQSRIATATANNKTKAGTGLWQSLTDRINTKRQSTNT